MEPTIYKPGAYKSPGVYKGAGGIYKGRGVYKDGAGQIDPNLIYELNINDFDISTLKDRDVNWSYQPGTLNPTSYITKENNLLKIHYPNSGSIFPQCPIQQFSIDYSKKVIFEFVAEIPHVNYNYIGVTHCSICYRSDIKIWGTTTGSTFYNGCSYQGSAGDWSLYTLPTITQPFKCKVIVDYQNNTYELSVNDVKYIFTHSHNYDIKESYFGLNNGSNEANNCDVLLHSLKIYYE